MNRLLETILFSDLEPLAEISLGFVAANLAFPFWARAFPETNHQGDLQSALDMVEQFLALGKVVPDSKQIAAAAYKTVTHCNLPIGVVQRRAGFSIAHIAIAPWHYEVNQLKKHTLLYASPLATAWLFTSGQDV